MTTTELIDLLKKNERGGASGKSRDISFSIGGFECGYSDVKVSGSGDGLVCDINLKIIPQKTTQTNGEALRMLPTPDLAEWLCSRFDCKNCPAYDSCCVGDEDPLERWLDSEQTEAPAGLRWINVAEGLPKIKVKRNSTDFCFVRFTKGNEVGYSIAAYTPCGWTLNKDHTVTHWMPIREPEE